MVYSKLTEHATPGTSTAPHAADSVRCRNATEHSLCARGRYCGHVRGQRSCTACKGALQRPLYRRVCGRDVCVARLVPPHCRTASSVGSNLFRARGRGPAQEKAQSGGKLVGAARGKRQLGRKRPAHKASAACTRTQQSTNPVRNLSRAQRALRRGGLTSNHRRHRGTCP